jgi:hypothetical protein
MKSGLDRKLLKMDFIKSSSSPSVSSSFQLDWIGIGTMKNLVPCESQNKICPHREIEQCSFRNSDNLLGSTPLKPVPQKAANVATTPAEHRMGLDRLDNFTTTFLRAGMFISDAKSSFRIEKLLKWLISTAETVKYPSTQFDKSFYFENFSRAKIPPTTHRNSPSNLVYHLGIKNRVQSASEAKSIFLGNFDLRVGTWYYFVIRPEKRSFLAYRQGDEGIILFSPGVPSVLVDYNTT